MLPATKVVIFLSLCNWCQPFDDLVEYIGLEEIKKVGIFDCPYFFQGVDWPRPKDLLNRGAVRICQSELHRGVPGKLLYATLFSTRDRIGIYSAYTVILYQNVPSNPRPSPVFWDRVATTLCNIRGIPDYPIPSELEFVDPQFLQTCRYYQAISEDYRDNGMELDKGHLSPSSINAQDIEKQHGTFTLTNAAPQYHLFNENSWREYECVAKQSILDLVPGQPVYIITGTFGTAGWMNSGSTYKSKVKIPEYYYKAVCYPGNPYKHELPWGYAIVKENKNVNETADYQSYITIQQFANRFFHDAPFGPACMKAPFGKFGNIFNDWDGYLNRYCRSSS